jgi:hypothetical protein
MVKEIVLRGKIVTETKMRPLFMPNIKFTGNYLYISGVIGRDTKYQQNSDISVGFP